MVQDLQMVPGHRNHTLAFFPGGFTNGSIVMNGGFHDDYEIYGSYFQPDYPVSENQSPVVANSSKNNTANTDRTLSPFDFRNTVFLLTVLLGLCGSVGNGTVIWLLLSGFRIKRNPLSVYILNLACADFTFLLCNSVGLTLILSESYEDASIEVLEAVKLCSFLVGLSLLMAVSTERCVSVLCPIWYRCHRPVHLSTILCALIWGLALLSGIMQLLCEYVVDFSCSAMYLVLDGVSLLTFLVLCVSSLTLLIQVQCFSWRSPPSRLYVTILLNVLAFMLLGLPLGASLMTYRLSSTLTHYDTVLPVVSFLFAMNGVVNPIIYFFVGRHRKPQVRKSLREVLKSALNDDMELNRSKGSTFPRKDTPSSCPSGSEGEGYLLESKADTATKGSHLVLAI